MNFRQKSKVYGKWAFVKWKGNLAIYAVCQNCKYTYPAYDMPRNEDGTLNALKTIPSLDKLHKYCPNCGLKMKPFNGEKVYKM